MSFRSFLGKLRTFLANGAANLLPSDSASARLRNGIYRTTGVRIGRGTLLAGGIYINGDRLTIGSDCFVNRFCYFDLSDEIRIGNGVEIGTHCVFLTSNHEIGGRERRAGRIQPAPVTVGDGAWIGTRVTILPGVSIGRGAVIAAGSVVLRSVPENTMAAGVPAVVKRSLD
ncbi:DapH/DapD/GlmU-related protein [Aureimonas sp. AU4]|uniref:acyltransferase n=1 Tax=Aureimonas sp. AU4 TaxID=1638163 RepID=UPI000784EAE2|nr:acyltransferase [Aureimonas sp. AU4]